MTNFNPLDNFIQIVEPMKDTDDNATKIWENHVLHKNTKFYDNYYPVLVKTSEKQLNAAKEICNICHTSLIELLSTAINKLYHLSYFDESFKITNPAYQYYDVVYNIASVANIMDSQITNYKQAMQTLGEVVNNSNQKLNAIATVLNELESDQNNVQKQLIIFQPLSHDSYKALKYLNKQLQKLQITSIDHIFQELLNSILNKQEISEPDYIFNLKNTDNIPTLLTALNKGAN